MLCNSQDAITGKKWWLREGKVDQYLLNEACFALRKVGYITIICHYYDQEIKVGDQD